MLGLYPTEEKSFPQGPSGPVNRQPESVPVADSVYIETQTLLYGNQPIQCTCPGCKKSMWTEVEQTRSATMWIACGIIALSGGCFGCCLIPFCINSLKDVKHYCAYCGMLIGTRTPFK